MKKIVLFALVSILISCSKDDSDENLNLYLGTSWTAQDDIAELIYGKTCTTTIEFLTETTCQEINVRTGMPIFSGTFTDTGTYYLKGDSVCWTIGEITITGKATGSALNTNMGTIKGGKRVYIKN
ncbi:MAG: hypothetical protein ABFD76_10120 [Smithella sp.]